MSDKAGVMHPINELEKKIGYEFHDKELIREALTHTSYVNEHDLSRDLCNERLEFLGDSVLSVIVSRYLFSRFQSWQEGDLTKIRAAVVCEKALAKFAQKIRLGDYLLLGHGEDMNNGRERPSITSDAFEAVLAAMYIDTGYNTERVSKYLLPFIVAEVDELSTSDSITDYKTALQQIIQQADGEKLQYVLVAEEGPDHEKTFTMAARLNSNVIGIGKGSTKREAEQNAAKEALTLFGGEK